MPKREEQKIHYPDKNELYNVYSFPNAAHLVVKTFTKKTNSTRQQAFTKNGKLISDFTFANDTGITTRWKVYYENGKVAIEGNMRTYKNPEEILFFESDDKLMNIKEGDWILRNEKGKVIQIQNYYLNWLEKVTIK